MKEVEHTLLTYHLPTLYTIHTIIHPSSLISSPSSPFNFQKHPFIAGTEQSTLTANSTHPPRPLFASRKHFTPFTKECDSIRKRQFLFFWMDGLTELAIDSVLFAMLCYALPQNHQYDMHVLHACIHARAILRGRRRLRLYHNVHVHVHVHVHPRHFDVFANQALPMDSGNRCNPCTSQQGE